MRLLALQACRTRKPINVRHRDAVRDIAPHSDESYDRMLCINKPEKRKRRPEFEGCLRFPLRLVGPASRSKSAIAMLSAALPPRALTGAMITLFTSLKPKRRLEFEGCLRLRFRLVGPVRKSKPVVCRVGQRSATHRRRALPRAVSLRGIGLTPEVGGSARLDHGLAPVVTCAPSPALARRCNLARAEAMRWQPEHIADQFERLFKSLNRHAPNNAGT